MPFPLPAEEKKEKVLIVAADRAQLTFLREIISEQGYICETAKNGPGAVEKAGEFDPGIILLDITMPVMDGVDACKRLKQNAETMRIPIIILSSTGEKKIMTECLNLGANDFLTKPIDVIELITRMRNLLQLRGIEDKNKALEAIFKVIENAKKEWEHTVDVIDDIVMLVDGRDHIIRCNRPLSALTGRPYKDLLNCKWQNILKESGLSHSIDNLGDTGFYHPSGKWFNYHIYHTKNPETIRKAAAIITLQEVTERKRREKEMHLLQHLTHAINESEDFNSALWVTLKEICETTGWVYGEAWTLSPDETQLVCSPVHYQKAEGLELFRRAGERFTSPVDIGFPGRAWSSKKVIWMKDFAKNSDFPRAAYAIETGLKSSVAIPVMSNSEVALVINLFTFELKEEDEGLITLASTVAAQLGSAMQRKRAEDELKKHKETLEEKNKELEDAYTKLKSVQSQVLQQEKMASVGQLAAGVAHEINNPIGFIMSNLGSLQKYINKITEFIKTQGEAIDAITKQAGIQDSEVIERVKENKRSLKIDFIIEDLANIIKESLDGADRVKSIVQDLKSFSRIDDAEHKMADISSGLESTIKIVWNELKYKTTLKKEYGDIPMTRCNPGQLNQVFMNILINAAHAIEDHGVITVKTWSEKENIFVSIADTGCGMPEDKVGRIFEPFFTTKEIGKGTGLGLSIAYDIIKKHNGDISVKSEVGKGTKFTIRIPVVEDSSG